MVVALLLFFCDSIYGKVDPSRRCPLAPTVEFDVTILEPNGFMDQISNYDAMSGTESGNNA